MLSKQIFRVSKNLIVSKSGKLSVFLTLSMIKFMTSALHLTLQLLERPWLDSSKA